MKTLHDYVRGYPFVPVLLICEYKSKGVRYQIAKEEYHDDFYYMKGEEVVFARRYPQDKLPSLMIAHLNNKKDESIKEQIRACSSFKAFVKFIKEETGEDYEV